MLVLKFCTLPTFSTLPEVFNPIPSDLLDELPDVDVGARVIDDCDLHFRTTLVLGEDRTQSVREECPRVEDRDHHRPIR